MIVTVLYIDIKVQMYFNLSLLTLAVFCTILADAKVQQITVSGRILCRVWRRAIFPVEFVTVRLAGRGLFSKTYGSTQSNSTGEFVISGTVGNSFIRPKLNIEVEYSYSGVYGKMEVESELLGINRVDKAPVNEYTDSNLMKLNLGNITFGNDHCKAYVMTYMAMTDYSWKTDGKPLPYDKLKVVTNAPLHGGTPYATTDKIRIPSGYSYHFVTAKHELAHTVRHSLVS